MAVVAFASEQRRCLMTGCMLPAALIQEGAVNQVPLVCEPHYRTIATDTNNDLQAQADRAFARSPEALRAFWEARDPEPQQRGFGAGLWY